MIQRIMSMRCAFLIRRAPDGRARRTATNAEFLSGLLLSLIVACSPGLAREAAPAVRGGQHAVTDLHPKARLAVTPSSDLHQVSKPTSPGRVAGRRFWVADSRFYRSRWYDGKHRKMINFGCTRAPYYPPSSLCTDQRGFHHGLDIAMACGTRLFAGLSGKVVRPNSPGALGSAYGRKAFRLRNFRLDRDIVFGHVGKVFVGAGDRVGRGDLVARASDEGAPDGCHLHFEVRPQAGSYYQAINPRRVIDLRLAR